jgi:hypothetical protein
VRSYSFYSDGSPSGIKNVELLENLLMNEPLVRDFAWMTYPLSKTASMIKSTRIVNIGQINSADLQVYGVSPNFLDVINNKYLTIDQLTRLDSKVLPVSDLLYSARGIQSFLMGTTYANHIGLTLNQSFIYRVEKNTRPLSTEMNIPCRPLGFCSSSTVAFMSNFPSYIDQDAIVSIPEFMRLSNGMYNTILDVPMQYLFISFKTTPTPKELRTVSKKLRDNLKSWESIQTLDETLGVIKQANFALSFLFAFATGLSMIISFFSLNSSMFINIHEQVGGMILLLVKNHLVTCH